MKKFFSNPIGWLVISVFIVPLLTNDQISQGYWAGAFGGAFATFLYFTVWQGAKKKDDNTGGYEGDEEDES